MHDFRIASGATELLLIRHGDAQHPMAPLQGDVKDVDLPLSERGRAQAAALAQRLKRRSIDAIYTSPLLRTRETADIVASSLQLSVEADERLREVQIAGVGSVGLHELAEIAIEHGGWSHMPGTESSTAIRERMREAIDDIIAVNPQRRVAIVSHAGAINAYIAQLLALKGDFFFPAGNTSISTVRARDQRRLVVGLNDIGHLESLR